MSSLPSIRLIVTAFVYFTAISLGAGILVINPARFLFIVPLMTGAALLGHAVKTANLNKLGYAAMWLWAVVLALTVVGMITEEFIVRGDVSPLAELPVARVLGTFCLIAIIVAAYIRGIQRATPEGGQRLLIT